MLLQMVHQLQSCGFCKGTEAPRDDSTLSWKEFFRDPSKWWDNRSSKPSPAHPDFKHRITKDPLWMNMRDNPFWVQGELIKRGFAAEQSIQLASEVDSFSPSIIWACIKNKDISRGNRIHYELQKRGLVDKACSDALVTMYAKCGELQKAQALLDKHSSSSVIPWNALIASYSRQGQGQNALNCYERMQHEGVSPNAVTYVCTLKACAVIKAIDKGKEIHVEISRQGLLDHNIILGNALVDMYAKCGALPQAQIVLGKLPSRDVISWSALITGYIQNGQGQQALDCYAQMQHDGISPNAVTYLGILKACALIRDIDKGKQIHDEILRQGLLEHSVVLGNALVDMYAKCGALLQAQNVLEKLPSRDVVSWNALITGYVQKGQGQHALECFDQMQREGILADNVTYVCILKACGVLGAIDRGKQIHDKISRQGLLEHNIELGGALVDMYVKCGALPKAQCVLESLSNRDVVSWSALIAGYAQEGQGEQALECFKHMQREGISPDRVTFLCLLNLCCHLGLMEKGQEFFDNMGAMYGLKPNIECYTRMVDLLGRAGHLVKAVELIQEMPISANSAIWLCLLSACEKWVDVNIGCWAFERAIELGKCDGAAYILMANIYAAAGMPDKARDVETLRMENKAWKEPSSSLRIDSNL